MNEQDRAFSLVLRQSVWLMDDLARDWWRAQPERLVEAAELLRAIAHLVETHRVHSGERENGQPEIEAYTKDEQKD